MGKMANQINCLRSYVLTIKIKAAYRIITILVYHYLFVCWLLFFFWGGEGQLEGDQGEGP